MNRWLIKENEALLVSAKTDIHSLIFQASFGFGWQWSMEEGTMAKDLALINFQHIKGRLYTAEGEEGRFLLFKEDEDDLSHAHVCGKIFW